MPQTCPQCGYQNRDSAIRCIKCDNYLTGEDVPAGPPPEASQGPHQFDQPPQQPVPPPATPSPQYTQPDYRQQQPYPSLPPSAPNTVMLIVLSVVMATTCCQPMGIIAVIFSVLAHSAVNTGDFVSAEKNAGYARTCLWIGAALFALLGFCFLGGIFLDAAG